jgi:hypothetical protein
MRPPTGFHAFSALAGLYPDPAADLPHPSPPRRPAGMLAS